MYKIEVTEDTAILSWTYKIMTTCPKGYRSLGNFLITAYNLANEKEFAEKPTVKDPCGLKGEYRKAFLYETAKAPRGVKMQGSGKSLGGKIIAYTQKGGKDCFREIDCPKTRHGTCAEAGKTVAVDKGKIKLGSELLIEDFGKRTAEDTGGGIHGAHIDIYVGDMTAAEAEKLSHRAKKVCQKA
jgi:3D (Asp-Asp-Asp) domain-containing protein